MHTTSKTPSASLDDHDMSSLLAELQALDYEQSTAKLIQLAQQHPGDARLLLLLAGEHAQAGRMDLAEAAFLSALQRDPDYAIARFQLGLLQFTSARPAVASVTWAPLAALPEEDPLRLFKIGFEYLAQNKLTEAADAIQSGVKLNTKNTPLNVDMQKVIAAIEELKLVGGTSMPASIQDADNQDTDKTEEGTEHFLVSAYRNLH